ncbi:hypothetical protein E2562_010816 [Oryza meyeriana var. granulata]|uniref:Uncharacterized protein n=1 Tax=Oryza meyeriana var. granulata TaxID=110450 RepID=A0A6G1BL18_9ORYZ|nr:hypothetical protein E2562_010816 [Oryza meyeriana var. granulata]
MAHGASSARATQAGDGAVWAGRARPRGAQPRAAGPASGDGGGFGWLATKQRESKKMNRGTEPDRREKNNRGREKLEGKEKR